MDAWLHSQKQRENAQQYRVLHTVAERVKEKLRDIRNDTVGESQPLIWLVHGRPGVGKSFVTQKLEELLSIAMIGEMRGEFQFLRKCCDCNL